MKETSAPKSNLLSIIIAVVASAMMIYQLIAAQRILLGPWEHQNIHLLFALLIVFLTTLEKNRKIWPFIILLLILTIISTGYVALFANELQMRIGNATPSDVIIGTILVLISLEATRQAFGLTIPVTAAVCILYFFIGHFLPRPLHHPPIDVDRIMTYLAMGFSGVYGSLLNASVNIIFLFIMFGSFTQATKTNQFFLEFGKLVSRRLASGAALSCVIASTLVGMITGTISVNIMIVGIFTIPLMMSAGYNPEQAGAIEAAASTGSQLMPPVMGAVAFVMSGFTGIPYKDIAIAAVIPALLYYFSIGASVQVMALKHNVRPITGKVNTRQILVRGPLFFIPLILIGFFLFRGNAPPFSAFWAIVALFVLSLLRKETRTSPREWLVAITDGVKLASSIAVSCACMGLIVAAFDGTGLSIKLPMIMEEASFGILPIALFMTMIVALILGINVPTIGVYVMVAVICAPVLIRMGAPLMATHLFILYYAAFEYLTPPVAMAALIASRIANADFVKTGIESMKLVIPVLLVPFAFIVDPTFLFAPSDLLRGAISLVAFMLGMVAMTIALYGYYLRGLNWVVRALMLVSAAGLYSWVFIKNYFFLSIGVAIFLAITFWQLAEKRTAYRISNTPV